MLITQHHLYYKDFSGHTKIRHELNTVTSRILKGSFPICVKVWSNRAIIATRLRHVRTRRRNSRSSLRLFNCSSNSTHENRCESHNRIWGRISATQESKIHNLLKESYARIGDHNLSPFTDNCITYSVKIFLSKLYFSSSIFRESRAFTLVRGENL